MACNAAKAQNFQFVEKHVLLYIAMQKDTLQAISDELIKIREKNGSHETILKSDSIGYDTYNLFVKNNKSLIQGLENSTIQLT